MMCCKVIIVMPENHSTSEKEYIVSGNEAKAIMVVLDAMCMARELNPAQKRLVSK